MNSTSRVTRELCKVVGVQQSHTTHTILMGNGMAERFNQMLIRMISILDDKQNKDWTIQIISLVHAYNTTKHESICYILFFLMFGRHPPLSIDAYLCIDIETSEKSKLWQSFEKAWKTVRFCVFDCFSWSETRTVRHKHRFEKSALDFCPCWWPSAYSQCKSKSWTKPGWT